MSIILYTTHCPLCRLVESKLNEKNIQYEVCEDEEEIKSLNYSHVPILKVGEEFFITTKEILTKIQSM